MINITKDATSENVEGFIAEYGPFLLTKTGVIRTREDTFEEWEGALGWAQEVEEASPWWVGALVEHGEHKHGDKYTQALATTGFALQTCKNAALVHRKVEPDVRRADVPFAHHADVAALPKEEQVHWLGRCADENMTRETLRAHLAAGKATAAGVAPVLKLVVTCTDVEQQIALAEELRQRGLTVKMQN